MVNNNKQVIEQMSLSSFLDDFDESEINVSNSTKKQTQKTKQDRTTFPINLILDFDRFLDYIEQHPIEITKTSEYISRKHLPSLNERMSVKAENVTANMQQESYPYIHFFYHIAVAGRLVEKVFLDSNKPRLRVTDRYNVYCNLTDTEKYMFLLESFWVDVNWSSISTKKKVYVHQFLPDIFRKLIESPEAQMRLDQNALLANLTSNWHYFFLYFEWFGIWLCEKDQERIEHAGNKSCYFVKTIKLTTFGKKVVSVLLEDRNIEQWNIPIRREYGEVNPLPGSRLPEMADANLPSENDEKIPLFYRAFSDLFFQRELGGSLPRREQKYIPGVYTFKVAFDQHNYCKVVLSAKHTMDDLHTIILKAFQFDDAHHLYSFFMDGKKWSTDCIVAPEDNSGGANASEIKIGSVGMHTGQRFMYLFDYGDEWTFTVIVEQIKEDELEPIKPAITEKIGIGPEQYFY